MLPTKALRDTPSVTATAAGAITLTFATPPVGYVAIGTAAIIGAPAGATWQAMIDGRIVLEGVGNAPVGPFYLESGQQLVLSGIGFTPGTTYTGSLVGALQDAKEAGPVAPTPYSSIAIINGQTVTLAPGTQVGISGTPTFDLAPGSTVDVTTSAPINVTAATVAIQDNSWNGNVSNAALPAVSTTLIAAVPGKTVALGQVSVFYGSTGNRTVTFTRSDNGATLAVISIAGAGNASADLSGIITPVGVGVNVQASTTGVALNSLSYRQA